MPSGGSDPLAPSVALLCKLGSIIVHVDEGMGAQGSQFDMAAYTALMDEPEVKEWLAAMQALSLLPVKR